MGSEIVSPGAFWKRGIFMGKMGDMDKTASAARRGEHAALEV
jgi:hypothetical protein